MGSRYTNEPPTGTTMRLPRMTLEPDWSQRVTWALISGVWSMRAWIWVGPKMEVSEGSW